MQYTHSCFCGNTYGNQGQADAAECGAVASGVASGCANGKTDCGDRNAVYSHQTFTYMGCYNDNDAHGRDLSGPSFTVATNLVVAA